MRFDARWDNIAPVVIGQIKSGKWNFEEPAPGKQQAMLK